MSLPKRDLNAEVLTTSEVAELLGVTLATVRRWGTDSFPRRPAGSKFAGDPGVFRTPGGHLRYHRDALQALLKPGVPGVLGILDGPAK